jgi:multimeric flavodoxin WrbA
MQTLIIFGSRNSKGQTARAAGALLEGIAANGGTAESIFLPTIPLAHCRQCDDSGWGLCRREGKCVIDDPFADIVTKISAADLTIFATPVYYSDLSESMKAFTDRLRRICTHDRAHKRMEGKRAVGLCVAGGGGGGSGECCAHLEKVLTICGLDVVDMIPVRRQNLDAKLSVLKEEGKRLSE